MAKQKYYAVWKGRKKGVFYTWEDCRKQVFGYEGALYKSFTSEEEANRALGVSPWSYLAHEKKLVPDVNNKSIIQDSIAVDAACSGNPGLMEYQGVYVKTGQLIFHKGPFDDGTNNIGEFLAIVHGLALLKIKESAIPIYTDSVTAISWVKNKKCNTKLEKTRKNAELFDLIERAERWLFENEYDTDIIKWDTVNWGEIPADFGRK